MLLWITLISLLRAINVAGPPQAPGFDADGKSKADRRARFREHESAVSTDFNQYIPAKAAENLRLATWNIHMLLDLLEEHSQVDEFIADVERLGADVLVMQEVPLPVAGDRLRRLEAGLNRLGYRWRVLRYSTDPAAQLGLMVASKHRIAGSSQTELGERRILLDVAVEAHGSVIQVLGTHLEVSGAATRERQVTTILEHLRQKAYSQYVLLGDFNSNWRDPELERLREAPGMVEVFQSLEWQHPRYTCWYGNAVDFILAAKALETALAGAYVYHSPTSDHLPVLLDLHVGRQSWTTADELMLLLLVVLIVVGVYGLALWLLPRTAWRNAYRTLHDFETL